MSSLRAQKIFQAIPDAVKRLGSYAYDSAAVLIWSSRVDPTAPAFAGNDAAVIDIDSATWASGNRRAVLVALPASDVNNTLALKTQSHAFGQYLDGSVSFNCYLESPATFSNAQAYFDRLLQHHLVGQMGSPCAFFYTANGTQPTVQGANGAVATATFAAAGLVLPYGGVVYPGGV